MSLGYAALGVYLGVTFMVAWVAVRFFGCNPDHEDFRLVWLWPFAVLLAPWYLVYLLANRFVAKPIMGFLRRSYRRHE